MRFQRKENVNDIADQMPVNVIAIPLPVALATDQVMVLGVSNQAQAVAHGIEYANVLFATLNGIVYVFPAAIGRSRFPNFLPRTTATPSDAPCAIPVGLKTGQ